MFFFSFPLFASVCAQSFLFYPWFCDYVVFHGETVKRKQFGRCGGRLRAIFVGRWKGQNFLHHLWCCERTNRALLCLKLEIMQMWIYSRGQVYSHEQHKGLSDLFEKTSRSEASFSLKREMDEFLSFDFLRSLASLRLFCSRFLINTPHWPRLLPLPLDKWPWWWVFFQIFLLIGFACCIRYFERFKVRNRWNKGH